MRFGHKGLACFLLGLFFLCPLKGRAAAQDVQPGAKVTVYYTSNTWGYLEPCPT